jgi:hypothetical protein
MGANDALRITGNSKVLVEVAFKFFLHILLLVSAQLCMMHSGDLTGAARRFNV